MSESGIFLRMRWLSKSQIDQRYEKTNPTGKDG
jgi:hypothetical protein